MKFQDRLATFRGQEGCWNWPGAPMPNGYCQTTATIAGVRYEHLLVHRGAFMILVGPIPEGMALDHLCRNRRCFNPEHLEPVSGRINNLRGESPAAHNARRTHCTQGHELTEENTLLQRIGGRPTPKRRCRTCDRLRAARDRLKPEVVAYRKKWWKENGHRYYQKKA